MKFPLSSMLLSGSVVMRHSSVMSPRQGTRPSLPVPHRHAASSPPSLLVLNYSHHLCLLPCVAKVGKYLCRQIVCTCEVCFWYVQCHWTIYEEYRHCTFQKGQRMTVFESVQQSSVNVQLIWLTALVEDLV